MLSNSIAAGQHRGGKEEPGNLVVCNRHTSHQCEHLLRTCPRTLAPALRVGGGTVCQPQRRLCSLRIIRWNYILHGCPLNGLLQEKEQGLG